MERNSEQVRMEKRERWLNYQINEYPVPPVYAELFDAVASSLDTSTPKRTWERCSREWLKRRRAAYAAFVDEAE